MPTGATYANRYGSVTLRGNKMTGKGSRRQEGNLPCNKVVSLFSLEERIAASLGMTLKGFRDRKALLLRQVEEVAALQGCGPVTATKKRQATSG